MEFRGISTVWELPKEFRGISAIWKLTEEWVWRSF
jgi:hypothetical protein